MEEARQAKKKSPLVIVLLLVIAALLAAILVVFLDRGNGAAQSVDAAAGEGLAYATEGVNVLSDQGSLDSAVQKALENAMNGNIALNYKNLATSVDGKVFTCYLGNSNENAFDMYIDIYSDLAFTDQLFLSGLIRPGEVFESIELDRALEPGTHEVYCAFTLVEDDHATARGQVLVALQFVVEE